MTIRIPRLHPLTVCVLVALLLALIFENALGTFRPGGVQRGVELGFPFTFVQSPARQGDPIQCGSLLLDVGIGLALLISTGMTAQQMFDAGIATRFGLRTFLLAVAVCAVLFWLAKLVPWLVEPVALVCIIIAMHCTLYVLLLLLVVAPLMMLTRGTAGEFFSGAGVPEQEK